MPFFKKKKRNCVFCFFLTQTEFVLILTSTSYFAVVKLSPMISAHLDYLRKHPCLTRLAAPYLASRFQKKAAAAHYLTKLLPTPKRHRKPFKKQKKTMCWRYEVVVGGRSTTKCQPA